MAIRGCADKRTERFLAGERVKEFQAFAKSANKALTRLRAATKLSDLYFPPSNRFAAMRDDREDQFSIRINDQWRVCFTWSSHEPIPAGTDLLTVSGEPDNVEICDPH